MKDAITELLQSNKISYQSYQHPPAETSQEVAALRGTEPRIGAKALILKSKGKFYLCVLRGIDRLDSKLLRKNSGISKSRLISEEDLKLQFQLERGAVPPFGNLIEGISETFFEEALAKEEYLAFNIGTKTNSIKIDTKKLIELVKPRVIKFCT